MTMKLSEEGYNTIIDALEKARKNAQSKEEIAEIDATIEEVETIGTY